MAITAPTEFDNAVSSGGAQTINHALTVVAGDIVIAYARIAAASTATATFDGNAMTATTTGNFFFGARKVRAWIYEVVTGGTNLVCTIDNGVAATFVAGAFVVSGGVLPLDVAAVTDTIDSGATSNTVTATPVTANAWMFVVCNVSSGNPAASTGSTVIGTPANGCGAFYNGPIVTPAATDMIYTMSSSGTGAVAFVIKPASGGATVAGYYYRRRRTFSGGRGL